MGEKMTLGQVRDWHRTEHKRSEKAWWYQGEHKAMADALAAHLTQPAQAVDVEEIRTVAGMLDGYCEASDDCCYGTLSTSLVRDLTKRITAALPTEGVGS